METPTVMVKPEHPSQGAYVVINEKDFDPAKHDKFEIAPPPPLTPAAPAPVVAPLDPIAALPKNWRDATHAVLRPHAEALTGRTPGDKAEAVAMIEGAMAERAKSPVPAAPIAPSVVPVAQPAQLPAPPTS